MVGIFITDDVARYRQSKYINKIFFSDGYIAECSFVAKDAIDHFNSGLIDVENEATRLMLIQFDQDISDLENKKVNINFDCNPFISRLPVHEKLHSTLFNFYKKFVVRKYSFQLVMERFFHHFPSSDRELILCLSDSYYLTQQSSHKIKSATYYDSLGHILIRHLIKQAYYYLHQLLRRNKKLHKADIAIFIVDIPNEVDLLSKFIHLAKERGDISLCIVAMQSGNAKDKKADISKFAGDNVQVTYLHEHKAPLLINYSEFYSFCKKINPLYSIFKKARICELEDVKYGFMNKIVSQVRPDVCMYVNNQEEGRIMSNVSAAHGSISACVDYSFFFDTYTIEKKIKFDTRACISEVSAANWQKHKDPTINHTITGFCKIDEWQVKPTEERNPVFDNDRLTILFASTWSPNPKSPLLAEKVKIAEQLSDICFRNQWNLIIKKHPSEFDHMVDDVLNKNKYPNQKVVNHAEIPLFDCMAYSDFVCTQNSSAFIEALFLNKPFSYITIYEENAWANLSYFAQEKEVGKFNSMVEYENYISQHSGPIAYEMLSGELKNLQKKYLYKTDGKASERLLELVTSFVKKQPRPPIEN